MLKLLAARIVGLAPLLLIVSFLTFLMLHLVPGDIRDIILGVDATPQQYEELGQKLGLDDPFVVQYGRWLIKAVQGDLGTSAYNSQAVIDAVLDTLPVTLSLTFGGHAGRGRHRRTGRRLRGPAPRRPRGPRGGARRDGRAGIAQLLGRHPPRDPLRPVVAACAGDRLHTADRECDRVAAQHRPGIGRARHFRERGARTPRRAERSSTYSGRTTSAPPARRACPSAPSPFATHSRMPPCRSSRPSASRSTDCSAAR